jgi:hypothetical protein
MNDELDRVFWKEVADYFKDPGIFLDELRTNTEIRELCTLTYCNMTPEGRNNGARGDVLS